MASKLYGVNATTVIFVFVLYYGVPHVGILSTALQSLNSKRAVCEHSSNGMPMGCHYTDQHFYGRVFLFKKLNQFISNLGMVIVCF